MLQNKNLSQLIDVRVGKGIYKNLQYSIDIINDFNKKRFK